MNLRALKFAQTAGVSRTSRDFETAEKEGQQVHVLLSDVIVSVGILCQREINCLSEVFDFVFLVECGMSQNKYMHPRNIYKNRPNFKQLAASYPEFRKFAKQVI